MNIDRNTNSGQISININANSGLFSINNMPNSGPFSFNNNIHSGSLSVNNSLNSRQINVNNNANSGFFSFNNTSNSGPFSLNNNINSGPLSVNNSLNSRQISVNNNANSGLFSFNNTSNSGPFSFNNNINSRQISVNNNSNSELISVNNTSNSEKISTNNNAKSKKVRQRNNKKPRQISVNSNAKSKKIKSNNNINNTSKDVPFSVDIPNKALEIFIELGRFVFEEEAFTSSDIVSRYSNVHCPKKTALKFKETYLHANYVHLFKAPNEAPLVSFIATQAPKAESTETFWGVAFNETDLIIDLTQTNELKDINNPTIVESPYYPVNKNETKTFGNISITCKSINEDNTCDNIFLYEYEVTYNEQTKTIPRIHYTGWKDEMGSNLEELDKLIETYESKSQNSIKPAMVHCRAGVGRTGTFIVLNALKKLYEKPVPNITLEEWIQYLIPQARIQRGPITVQTPAQIEILLEYCDHKINPKALKPLSADPLNVIAIQPPFQLGNPLEPNTNIDNPKRDAFCQKYHVPHVVYDHPAFYSGLHDSDSIEEISASANQLLDIAHKEKPDHNIYLLRPSDFQPSNNDLEVFALTFVKANGAKINLRLGYLVQGNEWVGIKLDNDEMNIIRGQTPYIAQDVSLSKFIEMIIREYDSSPVVPLQVDFYQKLLAEQNREIEDPPSFNVLKSHVGNSSSQLMSDDTLPFQEFNGAANDNNIPHVSDDPFSFQEFNNEANSSNLRFDYDDSLFFQTLDSEKDNSNQQAETENNTVANVHEIACNNIVNIEEDEIEIVTPLNTLNATESNNNKKAARTLAEEIFNTSLFLANSKNNAVAQCNLGYFYERGIVRFKNSKTAFKKFRNSANNGYAQAQLKVGEMYETGHGTPIDIIEALYYYKKSAEQGSQEAQIKFNSLKAKHIIDLVKVGIRHEQGIGTQIDLNASFKYLKMAADLGDINSQLKLAEWYQIGKGTLVNFQEALKYYKLAAEQGNPEALFKYHLLKVGFNGNDIIALNGLAICYERGIGTHVDMNTSFIYRKKAADLGNFNSQLEVAQCYVTGKGTPVNIQEAQTYNNLGILNRQLFFQSMALMNNIRSQNLGQFPPSG